MKHVYISGPMTGLPKLNFPAFHAAATALRAMGFRVTNPAELNPDPNAEWRACMRVDIKALCDCDGLVLLQGWEDSKGAHIELGLAHRLGMKVKTLDKLLDEKGLRAYWDQLALGSTETQPATETQDDKLAELAAYYQAEMQAARKRATHHRQRGDLEMHRRMQAVAGAWRRAARELALVQAPF